MSVKYALDFNKQVVDLDGKPIRNGVSPDIIEAINLVTKSWTEEQQLALDAELQKVFGKEHTLASVCVAALLGSYEDEKGLGDQERVRRYELARYLNMGGSREFNATERDLLKKMAGKRFNGSLVAPTIWEMLEGAEKVPEVPSAEKVS